MSAPRNYLKICLTGGPCSGKTSALTAIKQQFSNKFIIYVVPEVSTLAFMAGVNLLPTSYNKDEHKVFTHAICKAQIDLEAYFEDVASVQKKPVLIVTDRGVSDNFAYTHPDNKRAILKENNWSMDFVCNDRYDLVVYLVTAASGAVEFYTNANNEARSESPEEAIALDDKNAAEYIGHPNLRMVDNTKKGFGEKITRVLNAIGAFVNKNPETFYVHQFLLPEAFDYSELHSTLHHHHYKTRLTRLRPLDERKAVWWVAEKFNHFNKDPKYELVIQKDKGPSMSMLVETHQAITHEEYTKHLEHADPEFAPQEKTGISYTYKIDYEHDMISLGGIVCKDGKVRYLLRLIRDTQNLVPIKLPDYAEGAEEVKCNMFSYLRAKGW